MCVRPQKSIVTHSWESVVAWTRRSWLGFPPSAKDASEKLRGFIPAECHIMLQGLRAKFTQHADLRAALLATGDALIIEHRARVMHIGATVPMAAARIG